MNRTEKQSHRSTAVGIVSVDAAQHTDNVGGATYHMVFVDGRVSQIVERP